jgi:hypothetical protein
VLPKIQRVCLATRSHRQFKHLTKPGQVTVSGNFGDDMPKGTLASVKRQAGWAGGPCREGRSRAAGLKPLLRPRSSGRSRFPSGPRRGPIQEPGTKSGGPVHSRRARGLRSLRGPHSPPRTSPVSISTIRAFVPCVPESMPMTYI